MDVCIIGLVEQCAIKHELLLFMLTKEFDKSASHVIETIQHFLNFRKSRDALPQKIFV